MGIFLLVVDDLDHLLSCFGLPLGTNSACDNLRCTDCNFEVLRFDAQGWDESTVDYMFLRNNAPDPVKLGARLLECPGMEAL